MPQPQDPALHSVTTKGDPRSAYPALRVRLRKRLSAPCVSQLPAGICLSHCVRLS